ncbi:hypothetical protein [Thermoproteus tenax]|uniref:Transcriptional regulator containing HTH domain, ArsR family n=1 Tax=Thermoproteus tenax (strain ATCC 35583 / DSM 2078 / JCM 9277 / NBRC 100435 / Kra 1) TaxID=768679 RepID=G4RJV0_THETK|nr:hypothetical protein [Thermoproteus tenax]CCC81845.1 Transcriptional regulator containing HTH domain, ArsR family [Thermoproteus tenax Kra 1]
MKINDRLVEVLRAVVRLYPATKYRIAKSLAYPTSSVYYELSVLERRGYTQTLNEIVSPTLRGLLKYVKNYGCDEVVASVFRVIYKVKSGNVCKFLSLLAQYEDELDNDILNATFKLLGRPFEVERIRGLDSEVVEVVAEIVAREFPTLNHGGHRGILISSSDGEVWFLGYCSYCSKYLFDRCKKLFIKLE